jgi:HK97 family phage portal protein
MTTKGRSTKAKKATKVQALAAKTVPPDPEQKRQPLFLAPSATAGVRVNEDTALTLGAVWSCIRVITESLAGLPWLVFQTRPGLLSTGVLQPSHPLNWLLDTQPNPETNAFVFRETLLAHVLTWGNGYAEIERDTAGRPVWLWQITPDRVEPVRFRGRIIYDVANPSGPNSVLEQDEMFHIKGLGYDGLVGYSVIRMFARTIGMGIALEESASSLFANDTTPGGILEHPTRLSEPARAHLEESWKRRHGGPHNRRVLAILEEGL